MEDSERFKFGRSKSMRSTITFDRTSSLSPLVYRSYKYYVPDNVHNWRQSLLDTFAEEDDKPQDFQSSLVNINEEQFRKIPPFPQPSADGVELRHTLSRKAGRSQTFHESSTQKVSNLKNDSLPREIKGVAKMIINGEERSTKGQIIKITNNKDVFLTDDKGTKKELLKENWKIKSEHKKDSKTVILTDENNEKIQLKFDHSKDIDKYITRKRTNSESVPPNSPSEEKKKAKNLLMKFLKRRSSKEVLVKKGILKSEPIFGNTLSSLCDSYNTPVPEFITKIIEIIERPYNITSLGVYRASGNLAIIQKIRFHIDKNDLKILEEYQKDTDVLTGSLKMFFRELAQPLIPRDFYEKFLELSEKKSGPDIFQSVKKLVDELEGPHRETLKTLMVHLLKVIDNQGENKMSTQNMSIVWGPSLIHVPDSTDENLIKNSNNANNVIFLLLSAFRSFQTPQDEVNDCSPASACSVASSASKFTFSQTHEQIYNSIEDLTKAQAEPSYQAKKKQISEAVSKLDFLGGMKLSESKSSLCTSSLSLMSSTSTECCAVNKSPSFKDASVRLKLDQLHLSSKSNIPKFFVKIINLIERHLKFDGLYTLPGKEEKLEKIKKKILKGESYKLDKLKNSPCELTSLLLLFIDGIIEPLLPHDIFEDFILEFEKMNDQQRQLDMQMQIEMLDPSHKESIEFLMMHLNKVVECQEHNKLSKERICEIFAPRFYPYSNTDPNKSMYEKIFESIFNIYMSHTPTPEIASSLFGSSKSIVNKPEQKSDIKNTNTQFTPSKSPSARSRFKRLSKFNIIKSIYDNVPEGDLQSHRNEARFLDDNT